MKYLLVLALFIGGCAKPQNASQDEPSEASCPALVGLREPGWLIDQLGMAAEMATDVHQCSNGCGMAYYKGHLYEGCNQ